MYAIPLLYRVSSMDEHVSVSRLHHALQRVIARHNILRTALYLDTNDGLTQDCFDLNTIIDDLNSRGLSVLDLPNENSETSEVISEILNQSDLFDLSHGRVIRCHIFRHSRRCRPDENVSFQNDDLLSVGDLIMISIHHAAFDGTSTAIFVRDLSLAYDTTDFLSMNDNALPYIDYSVHEHIMDMTLSQQFWYSQLQGCQLECPLVLPVDRQRSSSDQRSGLAFTAQIMFDDEICSSFLTYASSHHLTSFQLALATFYVFLFKLTHGQTDLCVASINANRYRNELVNMIGMFVSTLPSRLQLDPHWSFDELVQHVQEQCLSILQHSHYPLQQILADFQLNQSNMSLLEIMFDFISVSEEVDHLSMNNVNLEQVSLSQSYKVAKFDFMLTFVYNPTSRHNRLSCTLACSGDLFDERTVTIIGRRLKHLVDGLFFSKEIISMIDVCDAPISKLDLILAEEADEMEDIVFCRQANVVNEGMSV